MKYRYYFSAFLTLRCNFNCSYCIQKYSSFKIWRKEAIGEQWVDFLTKRICNKCLEIIGGEPTIHKDFKHIIEKVHDKYLVTITTNLGSSLFSDMDDFIRWAKKVRVKWNTSFHPEFMSCDEYIDKVKKMLGSGLKVGQVASPDHKVVRPYFEKLKEADIGFRFQTLQTIETDREKETVFCKTKRFLISPEGNVYKCHYHLYSNGRNFGNVFGRYKYVSGFFLCHDYGLCHPCDFGEGVIKKGLFAHPQGIGQGCK